MCPHNIKVLNRLQKENLFSKQIQDNRFYQKNKEAFEHPQE